MNRRYQITAIATVLFASFVARESIRLEFYTAQGPGPGFFPLLLAGALAILAVAMFWQAVSGPELSLRQPAPEAEAGRYRFVAILASLVGTVVFLDALGFRLTFLVLYLVLLNLTPPRRWTLTTVLAVAGSFGVYQLFVSVFDIPLPQGVLGF